MVLSCFIAITLIANESPRSGGHQINIDGPFYMGKITEVRHGGGYTFLLIKERTDESFWIVVNRTDAKNGDIVRFQKQLIAKNFESKALNRKFDEVMFAENLEFQIDK